MTINDIFDKYFVFKKTYWINKTHKNTYRTTLNTLTGNKENDWGKYYYNIDKYYYIYIQDIVYVIYWIAICVWRHFCVENEKFLHNFASLSSVLFPFPSVEPETNVIKQNVCVIYTHIAYTYIFQYIYIILSIFIRVWLYSLARRL